MTTLAELRNDLDGPSTAYRRKMLHPLPAAPSVNRNEFIVERCRGKVVLDIGASGLLHEQIVEMATKCYGIDRHDSPGVVGCDLDQYPLALPHYSDVKLIVCGEVLEHLSNPGSFLRELRTYRCPVIITVPSAFSKHAVRWLERGLENVNLDHVAWYSPKTLSTLLARSGYAVKEWYSYNGQYPYSEGLIAVVESIA